MKHTISDSVFFCWIHFNSYDNNARNVSFCHQLKRTETRESRLRSQLQQSSTRVEEQNERFTTLDTQVLTLRQLCDRHEADAKEATSQHLKAKVREKFSDTKWQYFPRKISFFVCIFPHFYGGSMFRTSHLQAASRLFTR